MRILDEETLLACAAYVDLNPIRAAMAETLETSEFTSVQRRMQSLPQTATSIPGSGPPVDTFLSPLTIDEKNDSIGACANQTKQRCSDKGFLSLSAMDYLAIQISTWQIGTRTITLKMLGNGSGFKWVAPFGNEKGLKKL